ncbi:MAG: hypothetical protein M5U26_23500 [Planctomycetota bacterium]|nr:hypothetical protein [Planctomycetota bacterium]
MPLEIGTARVEITPKSPCHLAGYGSRNKPHEGVHDALNLRALYARGSDGGEGLLLAADLLGFGPELDARIRETLSRELKLDPQRIFLAGTHTHSAPVYGGENVNAEWRAGVEARALAAAGVARSRLAPVTLHEGRSSCAIGLNRRQVQPDGSITLGHNPEGPADRELILVEARDAAGRVVAQLSNYACHGVVLGPKNYQISGDWCGVATQRLEAGLDGGAALFLNGGCGNIDPKVRVQGSFEPVEALALEYIASVEAARKEAKALSGSEKVNAVELDVHLPHKARKVEDGDGQTRKVPLRGLRLGPLCLVGYPGEMFCETAMAVKNKSPHAHTMAVNYIDAYYYGYVPVKEAYATGGYEVRVSPYSEAAEAVLRQGLLDVAAKL